MTIPLQKNQTPSFLKRIGLIVSAMVAALLCIASLFLTTVAYAEWSITAGQQQTLQLIGTTALSLAFAGLTWFLGAKARGKPEPLMKPLFCQSCGKPESTIKVSLHRHIGLIILMSHKSSAGFFCKPCIAGTFWPYTLKTLFFGWWGIVSFIITPLVLINNTVVYIRSRFLSTGLLSPFTGGLNTAPAVRITHQTFDNAYDAGESDLPEIGDEVSEADDSEFLGLRDKL